MPVRARSNSKSIVESKRITKKSLKQTAIPASIGMNSGGRSERRKGRRSQHLKLLGIDQILGLARRLEEVDEKIQWCSKILSDLGGSSTADYIGSALEYYMHERESLLDTPSLAYAAIKDTLEWCKSKDESRVDPKASLLKAGLMVVESGLLQQQQEPVQRDGSSSGATTITADLKETARKVTVTRLERLLIEFLKSRKGALVCPQCKSRKTHFREYTVVFESHAMECESCGRLWKILINAID